MKDVEPAINFLKQALHSLPQENALDDARSQIKSAIGKIEHVAKKRQKRQENEKNNLAQEWSKKMADAIQRKPMNLQQSKSALKQIDQMIETQKDKKQNTDEPELMSD